MKTAVLMQSLLALVIGGMLAIGPVMADKPEWAGKKEKKEKKVKKEKKEKEGKREHFEDRHRVLVREYYGEHYRGGRCPPGLKKKHNGCEPPGKAKKWKYGYVLPREVVYYEVPRPLVVEIGVPPPGYRYVRVDGDILMITISTRLVVDAIIDLGR